VPRPPLVLPKRNSKVDWSSVPSRYHDGIDRHPAGPEGVAAPAPLHGRCVHAITAAISGSTSAQNASRNASRSRYRSTPSLPLGFVNGTGRNRRRHQTVREDLGLKELLDALTFVGHPPSDEHSACTCSFPVAALDMTAPP
jgi:hypothetical protein